MAPQSLISSPGKTAWTKIWLIIAMMSATIMQVLDTTIVNVALPHMQGSLGANSEEISWTLTSYLVSSAILMPLTGYFSDVLGRRRYLMISIIGFTIGSACCGAAQSLTQMVLFRLLQGFFGASLVPLSQSILIDSAEPAERAGMLAIWGTGIMVAPVLGPTLGGWLTDILNWRWTFYINLPIGILSGLLAYWVVPETGKKPRKMNWKALFSLSCAISGLQYALDRGNQRDWLAAWDIKTACFLCVFGFLGFYWAEKQHPDQPIFRLSLFADRNFAASCFLIALLGIGLYGGMLLLPGLLENLMNYPVATTGLLMAPRGIMGMLAMIWYAKFGKHFNPRRVIIVGILFSISGLWWCSFYAPVISTTWIILPLLLQGLGFSMIFAPLSNIAFSTLSAESRNEAAGVFSLLRTLGGSVGISLVSTFFARHVQLAWHQLSSLITPYRLIHLLQANYFFNHSAIRFASIGQIVLAQAQMLSYINAYALMAYLFVLMIPCVLLLKPQQQQSTSGVVGE